MADLNPTPQAGIPLFAANGTPSLLAIRDPDNPHGTIDGASTLLDVTCSLAERLAIELGENEKDVSGSTQNLAWSVLYLANIAKGLLDAAPILRRQPCKA